VPDGFAENFLAAFVDRDFVDVEPGLMTRMCSFMIKGFISSCRATLQNA
jgi:hypothetical protein